MTVPWTMTSPVVAVDLHQIHSRKIAKPRHDLPEQTSAVQGRQLQLHLDGHARIIHVPTVPGRAVVALSTAATGRRPRDREPTAAGQKLQPR